MELWHLNNVIKLWHNFTLHDAARKPEAEPVKQKSLLQFG